jgi:hypothetical protein
VPGPADRRAADAELGPALAGLGDREVEAAPGRSPTGWTRGRSWTGPGRGQGPGGDVAAGAGHHVGLAAFLPVAQGVAAHTALSREADRLTAEGDGRSRGQIMADNLVERVTGQQTASAVPVEVALVVSEETLLRGGDEPASWPAPARSRPGPPATWSPTRTPECGCAGSTPDPPMGRWSRWTRPAPVPERAAPADPDPGPDLPHPLVRGPDPAHRPRHPAAQGGTTSAANGQGLCEACNYTKQAPGLDRQTRTRTGQGPARRWRSPPPPDTATPATHPPLPGARPPGDDRSLIEEHFRRLIHAA